MWLLVWRYVIRTESTSVISMIKISNKGQTNLEKKKIDTTRFGISFMPLSVMSTQEINFSSVKCTHCVHSTANDASVMSPFVIVIFSKSGNPNAVLHNDSSLNPRHHLRLSWRMVGQQLASVVMNYTVCVIIIIIAICNCSYLGIYVHAGKHYFM